MEAKHERFVEAIRATDEAAVLRELNQPDLTARERQALVSGLSGYGSVTPLGEAIAANSLSLVRCLLSAGADASHPVQKDISHLHFCIDMACSPDILEAILQAGCPPNSLPAETPTTALHMACRRSLTDHARVLLSHGADPNIIRGDGASALLLAVIANNEELVQLLIDNGANVNHDHPGVLCPLQSAALEANLNVVNRLLQAGADPHHRSIGGKGRNYTCLIRVCDSSDSSCPTPQRLEVARRFLDLNVDINAQGDDGCTPLLLAATHGFTDVVEELLRRGADLTLTTSRGFAVHGVTPLQMAAQNGHLEIVKLLLAHGADVNAYDSQGTSPLIAACRNLYQRSEYRDVVTCLLDAGALVHFKNARGESALALVELMIEDNDPLMIRLKQTYQGDTLSDD